MRPITPFPGLLRAFFYERLVEQRNVSANTVRSHRDTWRLFLRNTAVCHKRAVAQLILAELTAEDVTECLNTASKSAMSRSAHATAGSPRCANGTHGQLSEFIGGHPKTLRPHSQLTSLDSQFD